MSRDDMFSGHTAGNRKKIKREIKKAKEQKEDFVIEYVSIDDIATPKFHDRSYVSRAGISDLAENLQKIGYLAQPIVVRNTDDGYERVIGYRRIEAFRQLGWDKIPARIMELTEDEAILLMLSENLQRENLNAYDETFSIVQYISISLDHDGVESTVSLLYKIRNFFSGNVQGDKHLEKQIKEIGTILEKLGKFQLSGFVNRLKVLNIEPEIIAAMREDNLPYSSALLINQVRFDKELMQTLISLILRKELNYALLKERVQEAKRAKSGEEKKSEYAIYSERVKNISKGMTSKKFESLGEKKQSRVSELLKELEKIVGKSKV